MVDKRTTIPFIIFRGPDAVAVYVYLKYGKIKYFETPIAAEARGGDRHASQAGL